MFKVIKCFVTENLSASKGKVIDIEDKTLINNLLNAGVIVPIDNNISDNKNKNKK